jgi:hypothetical protein
MTAINFPDSPTLNQEFTVGNSIYTWDGLVWNAVSADTLLPTQTGNAGEILVTNGTDASWSNTVTANATTTPAIIAKGVASQTANIFEAQNSSGTVLASVNASGNLDVVSPTAAGSTGVREITMSTSAPSGGNDGDVWMRYV